MDRLSLVATWSARCATSCVVLALTTASVSAQDGVASASTANPTKRLIQMLQDGGPLMIPIAACSFILCVFIFERAISLRRRRVIPRPFVKRFLSQLREGQLDREQALQLCTENRSPVVDVFANAVKKWGRPAVEVEQAIIDEGELSLIHI